MHELPQSLAHYCQWADSQTDDIPEAEYDAVFVSGKDKTPVGRVRSADVFDSHDLILFSVSPNYRKT